MKLAHALTCLAFLLVPRAAGFQRPAGSVRAWEHESSDLEADPRIHFGHLENGLRYAWMANPEPRERCYVRLHVDVGALAERDDEDGMAHFLEHMAFNGSEHFAAGTLIEWFQENGMEFGADLNASTTWSETIYKLDLPESDEETLREGLGVLRDWAGGMLLTQEEIDKEKGVIDAEETAGDTAGRRVFERMLAERYAETRYLLRDVIGERDVRAAFTSEGVRAFYERWYRPEAMTLALVGDLGELDPAALIEEAFGDFAAPAEPLRPEPDLGRATLVERVFSIHEPELPSVTIYLERLKEYVEEPDEAQTRRQDLDLACARRIVGLRFSELAKEQGAPFLSAGLSSAGGLEVYDGETLAVSCEPEKWRAALEKAEYELRRALAFGFDQAELEEVRAGWLRSLDEAVEREPTRHSAGVVGEILHAAEERSVPTSAAVERALLRPVIEALTVEECHAALVEAWSEGVTSLFAAGNLDLGEDAASVLAEAFAAAREREVEKGAAVEVAAFAYASDPERAGEITSAEHVEDLDVWLFTFANGVRLNVKQTDFKERQILVSARVAEGALTLEPEDYAVGWVGSQAAVGLAGLAAHSVDELRRLTAGKRVGVGFDMQSDAFSLDGATTEEDLLLQLELLCAQLEHPGWRDDGVRMLRDRLPLIFERFAHVSDGPLVLEFYPALYGGDPRLVEFPARAAVEAVEIGDVEAWLTPHLAQGPVEVTIVGDVDVEAVKAAATRTLGALAPRRAREAHAERRAVAPPVSAIDMRREIETEDDKCTVLLVFPIGDGLESERRRELSFLGQVVQDRLRLDVRERLGAAYSPFASSAPNRVFPGVGTLTMGAAVEPDKVETLVAAFRAVARELCDNGVTAEEVTRLAEPALAQIRDARRRNGFWSSLLRYAQERPESLDELRGLEDWYRSIDPEHITARAAAHLDPELGSLLVVSPAAQPPGAASESGADD